MIYADYAATAPMRKTALEAMIECIEGVFGNPSSIHQAGQTARMRLWKARESVAEHLHCQPREVYFTSGGTEANHQALHTMAQWGKAQGKHHLVVSAMEHPSVSKTAEALLKEGFQITWLKPNTQGVITIDTLQKAIQKDTCGVSVMLVNNEIGTVQPVVDLAQMAHANGSLFHTDAVQAMGHLPVDALGVDLLSLSAHKFGGAKGVGALYCKQGIVPYKLLYGGGQERGFRAGTENLPAIVSLAQALEEATEQRQQAETKLTYLRQMLEQGLRKIEGITIVGQDTMRVPSITGCIIQGIENETLLLLLDSKGICASAGSACASGAMESSPTLRAMGYDGEDLKGFIRFSIGQHTTQEEVETIVKETETAVKQLRKENI